LIVGAFSQAGSIPSIACNYEGYSMRDRTNRRWLFLTCLTAVVCLFAWPPVRAAAAMDDEPSTDSAPPSIEGLIDLGALETETDIFAETVDLSKLQVTVASTKSKNVFQSISTVSVIDQETIEKYNFLSVAEAVRTVAGFDVSRTYLKQNLPTARGLLQPHYANKVLVMINNVPTWHAVTGEGNIDRVDIHDVKRIEILKGPASVKYGTNAYSGAINIVLKDAGRKNEAKSFYVGAGNYRQKRAGFSFATRREGKDEQERSDAVFLNWQDTDGVEYPFTDETTPTPVSGTVQDYVKNSNMTWQHKCGDHAFLANVHDGGEGYLGVTPRYSAGAGLEHEVSGVLLNYTFTHQFGTRDTFRFFTTYDDNDRDLARSLTARSAIEGHRLTSGLSLERQQSDDFSWELGWDYDQRHSTSYNAYSTVTGLVTAENNMNDKDVYEYSFYSNLLWDRDKLDTAFGFRFTNNELFGSNAAMHLTLVRPLAEKRSMKFIYAQSFRAPSLFELNFDNGSTTTVTGNASLEPEESDSFELAYLEQRGDMFYQATVYRAKYDNKILRTNGTFVRPATGATDTGLYYTNGEAFSANGVELEMRYTNPRKNGVNARLNLGYLDGDDDDRYVDGVDTGVYNFQSVSEFTAMLGLDKKFNDKVAGSLALNYRSSTEDTEATPVDSVLTMDLNLRIVKKAGREFFDLSVKNLTNEESLVPEYVRPTSSLAEVPAFDWGRQVVVTYSVRF